MGTTRIVDHTDLLREPSVAISSFDAAPVRLDLDYVQRVRCDNHCIQLEDDATALDDPRISVDGVVRR
jgi:hypothetical protein